MGATIALTKREISRIINELPVTFIVGAGVSIPSGLPDWPTLAADIARALSEGQPRAEEFIEASSDMRPEVIFQAFYRVLHEKAIEVIRTMDPVDIRLSGVECLPNDLHLFLAKMIEMGHAVITTNYDNFIEDAMGSSCAVISTNSEIEEALPLIRDNSFSGLIKIHGTFRRLDLVVSTDSIGAFLQEVQRAIPFGTLQVLDILLRERPVIALGHSGQDDFDLYQRLLAKETISSYPTYWIKHEDKESSTWECVHGDSIDQQLMLLGDYSRGTEYYEEYNPLSIVDKRKGTLIKAYTRDLLKNICPDIIDWSTPESSAVVRPFITRLIQEWASELSVRERISAMASLFESSESKYLDCAAELMESVYSDGSPYEKAQRDLSLARIIYKNGKSTKEDKYSAQSMLISSSEYFIEKGYIIEAAEASLQLALLLNNLAVSEEATHLMMSSAEKAMEILIEEVHHDSGYMFELGTALRMYSLAVHRSFPDLAALSKSEDKAYCERMLRIARKYADASLQIINLTGNYLGSRGQGQSLNVMGLIDMKLGDWDSLQAGKKVLEEHIDISRRSGKGFEKEEHQGHRNLGLILKNIARMQESDKRIDFYMQAIEELEHALEYEFADQFNIRFNIVLIELEAAFPGTNWETVYDELLEIEKIKAQNWHWSAWLNTTIAKVAILIEDNDVALSRIKTVFDIYEGLDPGVIEKQTYGVQNGRTNLADCQEILISVSNDPALIKRANDLNEWVGTVEQTIPDIHIAGKYVDPAIFLPE